MKESLKIIARTLSGVSALALCPTVASAQDDPEAGVVDNTDVISEDSAGDGGIVVTAQRRDQRLQDVPISIAVVGGEELAENAISNITELAPRIPNFSITRSPAASAVTMRGVGASTGSPSLEQSVVIFVDGVYGGNNRQFGAAFLDVERIEVLRGPQGALVGKNTVAGALNILTRRPTDEFSGFINADYDFLLDGPTIEGGVNVPLGEGFAIRLVGRYSDLQGYMYNELTDRDEPTNEEFVGRASLGYENGGPLSVFLKYEHSESDGLGNLNQMWSPSTPGYELNYRKFGLASDQPETNVFDTDNLVLQVDYEMDWATLTSISAYSGLKYREHLDSDWTPAEGAISDFDMDLDQYSQELRIVSGIGGAFDYAAGALFQVSDLYELRTSAVLFLPERSNYRFMTQDTRDISVYTQLGYEFGNFRLQGSLRYTNVRKDANYQRFRGPTALEYTGGTQEADFDGEIENNLWDPALVLEYRPNADLMLYGSFQMGSKSGGFQGAISNAEEFSFAINPERSTSYEAGAKLGLGRGGYVNLAAFHTTYDELQISTAIASPDGTSSPFFTGNAGSARVIGVELESLMRVTPEFDLSLNGAWNPQAKYTSFRSGPCPNDGSPAPEGDRPGSCDLTGLRLPYAPRLQLSATARYEQELGRNLQLTTSTTANYRSQSRQGSGIDSFNIQDKHVLVEARIAVGASDGSWELGLVGRNLTDILTLSNVGAGGLARTVLGTDDARGASVNPPRQIVVTASFQF